MKTYKDFFAFAGVAGSAIFLLLGNTNCEPRVPQPLPRDDAGAVGDGGAAEPSTCYVGGCSGELCTEDADAASICIWREEFACYKSAECARQADGECGWTQTSELEKCIDDARNNGGGATPNGPPCYVGGCSGELCTDRPDSVSTCIWRDEFACYRDAECARQVGGECGWNQTSELLECLGSDGGGTTS